MTRNVLTAIWRRLQTCATGCLESPVAPRLVSKRMPQRVLEALYQLASVLILGELHTVFRFNSKWQVS